MRRKAKISCVQWKRRIASEVIMGRIGYVKAGYRWLRWHTFWGPIQTMPEPICAERRNCLLVILKS
ncbi:hypothetical protein OY03_002726 [Salmonella enterica subsp. enterica]|uniref:Uncharacterized protein n=5 Tax=Salmonella enterica I TaxID=59201 RepID=A0A3Z0PDP3_SALET|nr:hypothetical protein ELZ88_14850 [Salmonella enterica subsp. enterica serovar Karamoja]EAA2727746.1 hypothetical protein [Salmonella enterica subsp. enterica serovar Idikan]EAA2978334.1 hypothetical protein [Salmonella enterica subsp. enterica serovar Mbao]EAA3691153.1 hypothetical protein [Salmonella enterica subsp. enterica serovar Monschaui]EAA3792972.1 hypothetical protein [Salmonella enterica subsp. enterica serovar Livingstone]EAA4750364.1 hypothetical protein [Salmonella enterica sub